MTADDFFETKAPQLAFYGKAFLDNQLEYQEIKLYLWDTLEEWQHLTEKSATLDINQSDTEKVFWHLLHCFDKWPEWAIRGNLHLRNQVDECCNYIKTGGRFPQSCVGIRP
ncbi:hypothetical protein [Shewanella gaetbuli]|uniref:Uncharacterized protein n=1 Tax=Shewanella gaetbuli TaxID=220752 RepID=A0A9X1ZKC8_9GAMM|nr:hypothetical protein [Shewanella gaetbuli]MCL1141390.1 hypothetical protein [Shewanella gaetbuli]